MGSNPAGRAIYSNNYNVLFGLGISIMALQKLIKLAVFLIIALILVSILKKQSFFNAESGKISSSHMSASDTTSNQNEKVKAQLQQLASRKKTPYIAGCMTTSSGCRCYDQRGKVVEVDNKTCQKNVRDASSNQHKAFDSENR
ncbi:hypothetical protein ACF3NA_06605 [Alkanindiges sp. WGS2144]|uniref:hypothetical protein n=1 Tax=Alkanindiges sp. WGS2144 TaxID=3366808 RepID=UPI0037501344